MTVVGGGKDCLGKRGSEESQHPSDDKLLPGCHPSSC